MSKVFSAANTLIEDDLDSQRIPWSSRLSYLKEQKKINLRNLDDFKHIK
jgi:hypothetical protein